MAEPLGFQICVLKGKTWIVLRNFPADAKDAAWQDYNQMQSTAGFDGKKLTEETLENDDKSYSHTLSVQIFEPDPTEIPDKPDGPDSSNENTEPSNNGDGNDRSVRALHHGAGSPENISAFNNLRHFFSDYGEKLLGLSYNFFREQKTDPFAEFGVPAEIETQNRSVNVHSLAYETRYQDENEVSNIDLIHAESIEVLGTEFLNFIERNLVSNELREDDRFQIGICCFAVGALVKMDDSIRFKGTRGKALLNDALGIFLPGDNTINAFMENMPQILAQPASAKFIKAGALCFKAFQAGKFRKLEQRFKEIFAQIVAEKHGLPAATDVAIFFVHIADIHALRDDYGNVGVQNVLDDLWTELSRQLVPKNGKPLKSLGDGVMCLADTADTMMGVCASVLARAGKQKTSDKVPNHQLSAGGHFGRAVEKQGDYFGKTVQIAATLADRAGANEACFTDTFEEAAQRFNLKVLSRSTARIENVTGDLNILHFR